MKTEKTETKPFRVFVYDQVMRLSGLPKRPFTDAQLQAVANDLVNCLERLANGDRAKVRAVIDEAVDFEVFPGRKDLQDAWNRKYPPMNHKPCDQCRGTIGFIVETRIDGHGKEYTAARKCPCGAVPSLTAQFPEKPIPGAIAELVAAKVAK